MAWKLALDGTETDLATLANRLAVGSIMVARSDGRYRVSGAAFAAVTSADEAIKVGKAYLNYLNGVGRLSPGFGRVSLAGNVVNDENPRHLVAFASSGVTVHAPRSNDDEQAIQRTVEAAVQIPALASAIEILGRPELKWSDLRSAYEVLADAAGGPPKLSSRTGVPVKQLARFRQTANSDPQSGSHRPGKYVSPDSPMDLREGQELIRRIISEWAT